MPPSLVEAVDAFILACAARRLRGQERKHASMLIHVTRFNQVQSHVERQVSAHLQDLKKRFSRRIDLEAILERLRTLWEEDYAPTSVAVRSGWPNLANHPPASWQEVEAVLYDVLGEIKVRTINGTARDVLDYEEAAELGLKVIAIGGDKLSRGLTLEGLCVSYFLRASKMYDTLMQMGRWFGYRPGYADLCRLYTTGELVDWFGHITDASEELREEFDIMVNAKETPLTYGHKVASHTVLMVTSRLKMRAAKDLWLSFSGDVLETIVFDKDPRILGKNRDALVSLVGVMGTPGESNQVVRRRPHGDHQWEGHLWNDIGPEVVCDFLEAYVTHQGSYKVNSKLIAEFIRSMNDSGELTSWTVALVGGGEGRRETFGNLGPIHTLKRHAKSSQDAYKIGRLLSPRDEAIDLDEGQWELALEETIRAFHHDPARHVGEGVEEPKAPPKEPGGRAVRLVRGKAHPERGLLLLYALDPEKAHNPDNGEKPIFNKDVPPVVGFGISFPSSDRGVKVRYTVNNVMLRQWEREYDFAE